MDVQARIADLLQAAEACERALAADDQNAEQWLRLAAIRLDLGDSVRANEAAMRADDLAPLGQAAVLRAQLDLQSGQSAKALQRLEAVVHTRPDFALGQTWLGIALMQTGDQAAAEAALRRALKLDSRNPDVLANLATIRLGAGDRAEALGLLKQAHEASPQHIGTWEVLARSRLQVGDLSGAEYCLKAIESLQPRLSAHSAFLMAGILQERKAFDESSVYYRRAIESAPANVTYRSNFADMLLAIGQLEEGKSQHLQILQRHPLRLRSHLASRLALPGVYASQQELLASRAQFVDGLSELSAMRDSFRASPREELAADLRWSNFYLAYQGENDRALQEQYSEFQSTLLAQAIPLNPVRGVGRIDARIRIGFVSSFFHQCTVGWYFSTWITDLPKDRFEIVVYSLGPAADDLTKSLSEVATMRRAHHLSLTALAESIRNEQLDVLVYPELGMCPTTFALASLRLAPVQLSAWGHPVTSGHRTIDAYFSCDAMEPTDAESAYTERLIRLPGIGTRYRKPSIRQGDIKSAGIPEQVPIALVSQSLFKIHPDNDRLFSALKKAVPDVHFLFFEDSFKVNTVRFQDRLLTAGLLPERDWTFLPRMSRDEFLAVNRSADVMLDTLHWSGGNTSLDALSCGLPVVTLPGRCMRSRQTRAMLAQMNCNALIASDETEYLETAAHLLTSRSDRTAMSGQILDASTVLFEQTAPIHAFIHAVVAEVSRARDC